MSIEETPAVSFHDLDLIDPLLKVLEELGYETPSPIQAEAIPLILKGRDVLGQAQTGTGKTAAFALPMLSRIDLKQKKPQIMVLAPTRELAIQVAEAFQRYASQMKGLHVLPIYGGQDYRTQLKQLARGVHVVVGTPGRVMDHMRRGTLDLSELKCLVLDEADEMLRMGFIDDVEWILEKTPDTRQTALFSATMPSVIRRIAQQHLNSPTEIRIKTKTSTAETIRQRYWMVSGLHKLDALTRILEAETFEAVLIFVRTKISTAELAEKLQARGYAAAPLNGDIQQKQRERTVENLKRGKLDIVIATDVAARGLDVQRISHVINYDVPYDTESYVHRIGRTGRAGRTGDAILFLAPREKRMLHNIERATKQKIELMELPSTEVINNKRIADFKQKITDTLASADLSFFQQIASQYETEHNIPAIEVAAALAKMAQGNTPLLLKDQPRTERKTNKRDKRERDQGRDRDSSRNSRSDSRDSRPRDEAPRRRERNTDDSKPTRPPRMREPEEGMERFRLEVGSMHEVRPADIVGAIANEAGIDGAHIGRINILDDHSTVDLPEGMPRDIFRDLKKVWVTGQQLKISKLSDHKKGNGGKEKLTINKDKPEQD
ncbi:MAG: DEAD/DEAH box helicase [Pseudomonadales bacterium]|nr:DEAD/DEAH box helicase [Pseudomonadales bacterium]